MPGPVAMTASRWRANHQSEECTHVRRRSKWVCGSTGHASRCLSFYFSLPFRPCPPLIHPPTPGFAKDGDGCHIPEPCRLHDVTQAVGASTSIIAVRPPRPPHARVISWLRHLLPLTLHSRSYSLYCYCFGYFLLNLRQICKCGWSSELGCYPPYPVTSMDSQ